MRRSLPYLALGYLVAISLACGGGGDTAEPAAPPGPITVRGVTYGTALGPDQRIPAASVVQRFQGTDPVHVSVEIAGRPSSGSVTLRWPVHGEEATATVNLGDTNGGVFFAVGGATYVGGTLTHTNALPIGAYETIVEHDGQVVGRYPFEVGPPTDAIASVVRTAVTARGHAADYQPIDPATTFGASDMVHLTGCGGFGRLTWIQAEWEVAGTIDAEGTRSLTLQENVPQTCFAFEFRPAMGWPVGQHVVILKMNDREVGRYPFSVQ